MTSDLYRVLRRILRGPFFGAGLLLVAQGVVFASSQDEALSICWIARDKNRGDSQMAAPSVYLKLASLPTRLPR